MVKLFSYNHLFLIFYQFTFLLTISEEALKILIENCRAERERLALIDEKEQTLELLGLSPTQAHVYLTLIRSGKTSAKTLSKQSGVACPDIYRIMDNFEKIGLIEKIIEHPKKYKAIEIEQALPILINHKKEETNNIEKKVKGFIREIKQERKINLTSETNSDLLLLPPTKLLIQKKKSEIQRATKSIDSVISWKCHKELLGLNLKKITKETIEKGVKYRFIIEKPKNASLEIEGSLLKLFETSGSKIKYTSTNHLALFTIYDKKEATIYTSNKAGLSDTSLLWTNNNSILAILSGYFEYIWEKMEK